MDEKFKDFLANHCITVLDSSKKCYVPNHPLAEYDFFNNKADYNAVDMKYVPRSDTLYTVTIPERHLKEMCTFESTVFNNCGDKGQYNLFQLLMEQKAEEKRLREEFPALQKAYEKYSMVLNLCKNGNF